MRTKLIIVLLCFLTGKSVSAQSITVGVSFGIGTYSMQELKDLNEGVIMPFSTRVVENYPAYYFYRPSVMLQFNKFGIGVNYNFQSTGSRVSGKDYSGEYRFDCKVHSNSAGIISDILLISGPGYSLSGSLQAGLQFSELRITQYFKLLTNPPSGQTDTFTALHFYGEPGLRIHFPVLPRAAIGVYAGYSFQMGKQFFKNTENKELILVNPSTNEPVKPNWNGIRIGVSVFFRVGPKQNI